MTSAVERLDYTNAPPGYRVGRKGFILYAQDGEHVRIVARIASSTAEALAAAWAHYKREHDPPGFTVRGFRFGAGWVADVAVGIKPTAESTLVLVDDNGAVFVDACAARVYAWAWHDRRHALAERDRALRPHLPESITGYLAMSDDDCKLAEAIIADDERRRRRQEASN